MSRTISSLGDLVYPLHPTIRSRHDRILRKSFRAASSLFFLHFVIWGIAAFQNNMSVQDILKGFDASWYLGIAQEGYNARNGAFLPGFPVIINLLGRFSTDHLVWLVTAFSTVCFVFAFIFFHRFYRDRQGLELTAILLLLSPASYIFHSVHTESLFLLLAILAFWAFRSDKIVLAAIAAGLASVVRHQGVFLALALGFGALLQLGQKPRERWSNFFLIGIVSSGLWSLSGWYHVSEGREFFPAVASHQAGWFVADSWQTYIKTLFLANPIQNFRVGSFLHHGFFLAMLWGSLQVWRRGDIAAALYCLFSLLVMPMQGELIDAFRFGLVLFPVYAYYGDRLWGLGRIWQGCLLTTLFALNLVVTWQYGILRWAY